MQKNKIIYSKIKAVHLSSLFNLKKLFNICVCHFAVGEDTNRGGPVVPGVPHPWPVSSPPTFSIMRYASNYF